MNGWDVNQWALPPRHIVGLPVEYFQIEPTRTNRVEFFLDHTFGGEYYVMVMDGIQIGTFSVFNDRFYWELVDVQVQSR